MSKRRREESEERQSRSRKKKDSSSSDSEDRKKLKKKKKKRSRSSSSSSSPEPSNSNNGSSYYNKNSKLTLDENVLKMVASIKSKSGKKSDEMLVDLLSKMSEAYSDSKSENKDLKEKVVKLELQNQNLRDELAKMKEDNSKFKNVKYVMKEIEPPKPVEPPMKIEPVCMSAYHSSGHRKLKKSRPKKLVKSNKSISPKKIHFL